MQGKGEGRVSDYVNLKYTLQHCQRPTIRITVGTMQRVTRQ